MRKLQAAQADDQEAVFKTLSPRLKQYSEVVIVLNNFLAGQLDNVMAGNGAFKRLGTSPRKRVLRALDLRKKYGFLLI
jgi:hypothetical protein